MNNINMAGPWITQIEEDIVLDALKNGWYGSEAYHYVETFEKEFAAYHGRKYALMTPNCTTAIHLLLAGLGIGNDDEVIVPECTWIGSTAGITYVNAKPIFADIDQRNWCLGVEQIKAKRTQKTKAVIVVDVYGNMPDWDQLERYCADEGILLIEDAAEALGSTFKGRKAGSFGVASVFSFHRTKTITTGEGGMLLLDQQDLFERCRFLRDHGRAPGKYYNTEVAYKYMPFNLQAALGYAQFKRIDELVDKKRWIYKKYKEGFASFTDLAINSEPEGGVNGAWATSIVMGPKYNAKNTELIDYCEERNVPLRPFFYPLSSLPAYGQSQYGRANNPTAYDIASRGVHLPCALDLTSEQLDRIIHVISSFLLSR